MLHLAGQDSRVLARALDIPIDEARRVLATFMAGRPVRTARNVRRASLDRAAGVRSDRLHPVEIADAADGFRKYLFEAHDGARFESVRIPLFDTHYTLCLSSQAGCALGCTFCATGRIGLTRSLEAWEIVSQLLAVRADPTTTRPIRGAVFMGMGEPFHNYENVLRAAYALCDPAGGQIAAKAISISTAGVVPMIRRYTAEGHKFRLCVSLTAATHEKRMQLMPIEKGQPLDDLMDAVREHAARRGRVTLEYVMIAGVNCGREDAEALGRLLSGIPVRLNVIPVNDTTDRFRPPTQEEWLAFRAALQEALPATPIVRRYSGGQDRNAGCGMLAATTLTRRDRDRPSSSPA